MEWVRRRDLGALQITEGTLGVIEKAFRKPPKIYAESGRPCLKTSAEVLEFESLRQLLGRYVSSPLGRRELEKVEPHADRARLDEDLAEAGEAIEYLRLAARPQPAARGAAIRIDFGGLPDVEPAVHKLRIEGASLEPKEIFDLFALLDRAADAKIAADRGRRAFPAPGPRARRPSAISARC